METKRKIAVLGAGESGVGAAILAQKKGFDVWVSDKGKIKDKYLSVLKKENIPFEQGSHDEEKILSAHEVIKSPGIPENAPMIVKLRQRNIPIISEIEFAGRYTNAKKICITGSNGKTTTTMLTYHIFKKAGLNVGVAGNVGKSFALQVATENFDYYVLELSSFQLDDMYKFKADVAILLNITPDHLDRYDHDMQKYVSSKFRVIQNQDELDSFIYCLDDEVTSTEISKHNISAMKYPFSVKEEVAEGAYKSGDEITINIHKKPFSMAVQRLSLFGTHNVYNSMAAAIAARVVDIHKDTIRESLADFQNIEHRLEHVASIHGVEFINDSKATNINSTWFALETVTLPECDGRVISVPVSFKENHRYLPDLERIHRVAAFARRWAVLRSKANSAKRIAVVLSNAGGKAQRIGGAVGLDTPASLLRWLSDMRAAGYETGTLPQSPEALMAQLLAQGCYDDKHPLDPACAQRVARVGYSQWFLVQSHGFQKSLGDMWGKPTVVGPTIAPPFWRDNTQSARRSPLLALHEPHTDDDDYLFSGLKFGNVFVAIQPPRGFGVDPEAVYHAPDLPPCHHYAAFYRWLADGWRADAVIHFGTHGTLEWLPGKSLAMSADCAPDALLGDLPLIYPFVVNNPGEGAQAKRRTHAVIVDHLVPPLTHADTYGPLATLARLVEEYYRSEVLDTNKLPVLRRQIWDLMETAKLEEDLKQIRLQRHGNHEHPWDGRVNAQGIPNALERLSGRGFAHLLEDLDAYLCDLGRAQIRGGLHVFGVAPEGQVLVDLMFAILRSANGNVPSLIDAVTRACGIEPTLLRDAQGAWPDQLSPALSEWSAEVVTVGQVRIAVDELARALLRDLVRAGCSESCTDELIGRRFGSAGHPAAALTDLSRIMQFVCESLAPNLARTTDETRHLLAALNGGYVPAGPAGSPSRGMAHVLPTGRNFYTVDPRGLPTPAAWTTGSALAREALARHFSEKGGWPESIALSIWGTPTMRTGGDDIAQGLALLGVRPVWEAETRRTCGFEIISLADLGRPRIDVTLRVSGFFRDAFPSLMHLFDDAFQRVVMLDEPGELNFARKHWLAETSTLRSQGFDADSAGRRASYRVFSSKPGAYGAGLIQLMESSAWRDSGDIAQAVLLWGGWAYSAQSSDGVEAVESFRRKLAGIELVLHNQDNLEQDLFDSSDYFEFHGGLVAAVSSIVGAPPRAYFGDSSDPSRPAVRTLQGEALRVYRSRVVNPKWLQAMQRHGYRGGLELAATVDSLFGFSATAGVVTDWMFEGVAESYAGGEVQRFLQRDNPWALHAIVERLIEAEQRQLWNPKPETLDRLHATLMVSESTLEQAAEIRL